MRSASNTLSSHGSGGRGARLAAGAAGWRRRAEARHGELARVAERDPELDLLVPRRLCRTAAQAEPRWRPLDHLDLPQSQRRDTQGLHGRFLGGEPDRQVASRPVTLVRVPQLGLREDALGQPRTPLQGSLQALDLQQVDADPGSGHSTVTVLARLRGWSTLR